MAYRPTQRTEARRTQTRARIVRAATELVAQGGYREAQVAAVAKRAGIATGTVYRHFPSKADLLTEVFRVASQREVDAVAAATGESAAERLAAAVETFARRALRGRRLAWALLAEPVDPAVEAERLQFRRAYADVFARAIAHGVETGELPPQDPAFTATALVGAIGEALVGPLSPTHADTDADALVAALIAFCRRSTTDQELSHMSTVARPEAETFATHEVRNQVPPLEGRNLFLDNTPLVEGLDREGGGWARERAAEVGAFWGGAPQQWGFEANENPPVLHTHDRFGNRLDAVTFHPAWHQLMARGVHDEMHALPWNDPQPGAHVARAAIYLSGTQAEAGFGCPITMTFAAVPALQATPEIADEWIPRLTARGYDGALKPASEKPGAICGMAMTEKQGGSDVRANTTTATPIAGAGGPGSEYLLVGHKWFCSAPMSDLFLVLAQTDEGLSCFAVPRFLPDGTKNTGFQLQRLKDKLGNKSNASSEVEFKGAWGQMLGEPGRGVPTIIEMVGHTRLDCVIGGAGGMRTAVSLASWHAMHRAAFGRTLIDQPLMRNVLADLAVESEAATAVALRLCRAYDEALAGDERADHFKRLATAVAKYHVCKRVPNHAFEALECLGGNGYVEASGLPRLYREAPLCSIWEGSGNVMALDVLRALARTPEALDVFLEELDAATGADTRYDAYVQTVRAEFSRPAELEHRARIVVERMALALQASQLLRHAPAAVADAFVGTRLAGDGGMHYGTLPPGTDVDTILDRNLPVAA